MRFAIRDLMCLRWSGALRELVSVTGRRKLGTVPRGLKPLWKLDGIGVCWKMRH
jgi:hypothetical protein